MSKIRKIFKLYILAVSVCLGSAWAQYPSDFTLKQLEKEIIKNEDCVTFVCNGVSSVAVKEVNKDSQSLKLLLNVDARIDSLIELPINYQEVIVQSVQLNQKPWYSLGIKNNQLRVAVPKGSHQFEIDIIVKGKVLNLVNYPKEIKNISSSKDIIIQNSKIEILTEQIKKEDLKSQYNIFPFFKVDRTIILDDKWKVKTVVSFLDNVSLNKPMSIEIDALPDETVLSSDYKNENNKIRVDISSKPVMFESILKEVPSIKVKGSENYVQTINFSNTSNWLFNYEGLEPTNINQSNYASSYTWIFWPGDSVQFNVRKPTAVNGDTVAVQSVNASLTTDKSVYELTYVIQLKSSLGDKLKIQTPNNTQLTQLLLNGQKIPFKVENNNLLIDINAGNNTVQMVYDLKEKLSFMHHYPQLKLSVPSINYTYNVQVPIDRWVIWTGGADLRASILLWGILLSCILLSYPLAKAISSPLGWLSWSVLLLGLSQAGIHGLIFIVLWFGLLSMKFKKVPNNRVNYNLLQIALVILTMIVFSVAIETVAQGLLNYPNVFLEGINTYNNQISWYSESAQYFTPWLISLPVWTYRVLMFAWSMWFAFNIMNWLKWAWESFSHTGVWIATPVKKEIIEEPLESEKSENKIE